MISTYQALVVALVAITPGATYTFAYERWAGAYGAHLADRLVRFLVASALLQAALVGPGLAIAAHLETDGIQSLKWWQAEVLALAYALLPFCAGALVGRATNQNKPWAQALVGTSRHPRAWDHLFSGNRRLIVRLKMSTGEHLAGLFEPSATGIASYAAGVGEEADLYLSRQLKVNTTSGEFEVDDRGSPVPYEPTIGLLVRAAAVESWHIQEVDE